MSKFAIVRKGDPGNEHWHRYSDKQRVFVVVRKGRKYAEVEYDTYSSPKSLSRDGIDRVGEVFDAAGSTRWLCGRNYGHTKKDIPIDKAMRLAEMLCDFFDKEFTNTEWCPKCRGRGDVKDDEPCRHCAGKGVVCVGCYGFSHPASPDEPGERCAVCGGIIEVPY